MKVISLTENGGLSIYPTAPEMLDPSSATRGTLANAGVLIDATDADVFAWVKARVLVAVPTAINVREIEEAEVPADRSYRGAWEADGATKITHNMPKARDIHRDKMRVARDPKLAALDIDYQRADEAGDTGLKTEIATQKQVLRDVTAVPEIDAATDIDELKAAWPDVLI